MVRWLITVAVLLFAWTGINAFSQAGPTPIGGTIVPRNPRIASMQKIQVAGTRPKWRATGDQFTFDRRNADGLYDLYVADREGSLVGSLTDGRPVAPRHAGNGIYRPQGDYVVFIAQVASHFLDFLSPYGQVPMGEPGVGLFNNLWATNGVNYWRLTNVPIKMAADDGIPAIGTVNPHFSWDGSTLIWTERYADGGNNNWGRWRLKVADFVVSASGPRLQSQRVLFTPPVGTYITAMEFLGPDLLLVAGNLSGQHEYFMDLYVLHLPSGVWQNLTNSPDAWEEGACVAPSGKIVYMTNRDSRYPIDTTRDWAGQPVEREYWMMNPDGSGKERLTYFNDPTAPEYQGSRAVPIICGFSPDGKTMIGTVGRDIGDETKAFVAWQLWMIKFANPL